MTTEFFAGLDWAVHRHAVCFIGAVRDRFETTHNRDGLAELTRRLARFGAGLRIAIERLRAGSSTRWSRPGIASSRSIPMPSRPAARATAAMAPKATPLAPTCWPTCWAPMATAGHRWAALSPQSDSIRALRALVRSRDDLVGAHVALGNRLQSTLETFWPRAAGSFADIPSPIGLAFLRRYPPPTSAARLGKAQPGRFCRDQHHSGRRNSCGRWCARSNPWSRRLRA